MKRLEDANISWESSKYQRFLGPDELKEFSIKIDEEKFNKEVFKCKFKRSLDLTKYTELDLNHSLRSTTNLRDALLKKIEVEKKTFLNDLKRNNYFIKNLFNIGSESMQKEFYLQLDNKFREKYKEELEQFERSIKKIEDKIHLKIKEIISIELC